MKHRVIGVTEFKAKCLALLDEIGEHGGKLTITKRGKPLATVGPAKKQVWRSLEGSLAHLNIPPEMMDPDAHLEWNVLTGEPDVVE